MSTLILLLPPRERLRAEGRGPAANRAPGLSPTEFDYAFSANGRQVEAQGRLAIAQLPRADQVVLMPADADIAWHRARLPRIARARWTTALASLLEDQLLDEPESLHLAVAPDASAGESAWVAVLPRAPLAAALAALESAQLHVDRIAPLSWPAASEGGDGTQAKAYFQSEPEGNLVTLQWSDAEGASPLSLAGGLARSRFTPERVQSAQWSASAPAAAAAESWLGAPVRVQSPAQRALAALDGDWDLRQFELARRTRGLRALREAGRVLMQRHWRPVRWGLAGLVVVQLLGLNLQARQERRQLEATRAAQEALLHEAYPQVRNVRDAPLQMLRETETLRARAGVPGDSDLETLLSAAASAWPAGRAPIDAFSFESGQLTLPTQGWSPADITTFQQRLRQSGWQLEQADGSLKLSRSKNAS